MCVSLSLSLSLSFPFPLCTPQRCRRLRTSEFRRSLSGTRIFSRADGLDSLARRIIPPFPLILPRSSSSSWSRTSDLRSARRNRARREGRFLRQGRARGRVVWCCWNTRRENERVSRSHGVVRSCANRECYATREPPAGGCLSLHLSHSLSLSLTLSLSLSLSLSSLLSRALFFSLSPAGRDGSDRVEGVARVRRGGRGAEISPRGSVTNSIRRGSKRGTGRGSGG